MIKFLFLILFVSLLSACAEEGKDTPTEGNTKPEPTRFTQQVVADGLDEPLQVEFDKQGHVYWIERTGRLKRVDESTGQIEELGTLPISEENAPGLIGLLLAKDFEKSRQLYLYYSAAEDKGEIMRLSRFTLGTDHKIEMNSEIVMLRVPWEQPDGEHFGGGMAWDQEGNLYLSVGGDTAPTQYAPMAFTNEGGRGEDAARAAGNTNDLRGAILRIHPQPDGTGGAGVATPGVATPSPFAIPKGNLFAEGTPQTRPEIYVMGNRNPWRLTIDSKTGYLHWGEVGPDAGVDSEKYGPMGFDEFNVAREAGNFGWPFFVGKNLPYHRYDYATGTYLDLFDPKAPLNESPNNTGLRELPPAQAALIAYPYRVSDEWPVLGSAARSAVGGPIFRRADFVPDAPRVFPDYYEGKWLITDYVRNWIMVVTMNEERTQATSIERFLPAEQLSHKQPLDMDFSPSGDLYIVEYGSGRQGRLSRIAYNAGNRAPIARASADPLTGAVPLQVSLSSRGSIDYDGDDLNYTWIIRPVGGGDALRYTQKNPLATIRQPGRYEVALTVDDPGGAADSVSFALVAGNERPDVHFEITSGNRSFYFPNDTIEYQVQVNDHEDGSLIHGSIALQEVSVTAEYIPSGMTPEQLSALKEEGGLAPGTALRHLQAKSLISQNHCVSCHQVDAPLVGPSFMDVAQKYKGEKHVFENLTKSIVEGSSGKWGNTPMPPHPMLAPTETRQIIAYILDLADSEEGNRTLSQKGVFQTVAHQVQGDAGRLGKFFSPAFELGTYVFHASYTDQGSDQVAGLPLTGDDMVLLRYPLLAPETADIFSEQGISFTPSTNDPGFIFTGQGGYIGFKNIDLTGINRIVIGAITRFWHWSHFIGATIELRLDSPTGRLIGEPFQRTPPDSSEGEGPFFGDAGGKPIPVDVSAVNGMHDVYIVIHNSEAEKNDALIIMTGIAFEQ